MGIAFYEVVVVVEVNSTQDVVYGGQFASMLSVFYYKTVFE